jgi:hypothetical protein
VPLGRGIYHRMQGKSLHGLSSSRAEGGNCARLAKQLVDFARMQFLGLDHLPGIFLEHHDLPSTVIRSSL